MALTLEQLQAERDAILKGMSSPQEVHFAERGVTHRPQADLEAALRRIDNEIAGLQGSQNRVFTIQTKRGI